jgi:hypothetical protein
MQNNLNKILADNFLRKLIYLIIDLIKYFLGLQHKSIVLIVNFSNCNIFHCSIWISDIRNLLKFTIGFYIW